MQLLSVSKERHSQLSKQPENGIFGKGAYVDNFCLDKNLSFSFPDFRRMSIRRNIPTCVSQNFIVKVSTIFAFLVLYQSYPRFDFVIGSLGHARIWKQ